MSSFLDKTNRSGLDVALPSGDDSAATTMPMLPFNGEFGGGTAANNYRHSPPMLIDHPTTFGHADVPLDSDLINSSCTNNFNNAALLSASNLANTNRQMVDRSFAQYSDEKRRQSDLLTTSTTTTTAVVNSKLEKENDCDIRSPMPANDACGGVDRCVLIDIINKWQHL